MNEPVDRSRQRDTIAASMLLPRRLVVCLASALLGCADVVTASARAGDAALDEDPPDVVDVLLPPGLARSLSITDVALFQTVRVPLLVGGNVVARRSLPVIAGRRAVVRVYVRPEAGYSPVEVEGELTARRAGAQTVVRDRRYIDRESRDALSTSVFSFELPAEMLGLDTRFSVRLLAPGGAEVAVGPIDRARFPYDGRDHAVPALDGGPIEVTLVPFRWDADRSGRLPDTSVGQVESFRALLQSMYPVREVRIDVHEPVAWSRGLLPSGDVDFGAALSTLRALRIRDDAPRSRYYYGMVAPAEYIDLYCTGPCTLGQAYLLSGPDDPRGKVAAGVGLPDNTSARTFAHELGHSHGRPHAPCGGAQGVDPAFPYSSGTVGVWGYDARRSSFIRPAAFDFMGYCTPDWVSDYTYAALWERILAVNGILAPRGLRSPAPQEEVLRHRVLRYGTGVAPEWLDALDLTASTDGLAALRWLDASNRSLRSARAQADALAESDETHVLVPPAPSGARALEVTYEGVTRRVVLPSSW